MLPCPVSAQRRQQHRRTLDGRLCAAAFVFDRQTHTGCSDGSNPDGEHGREWCYVDAQVARRHRQEFARGVCSTCSVTVGLCSCWVAVVESPRGAIAVLGFVRRMCCSPRGWRGSLFNWCGVQCARGSLQHLVTHLRCRMPRHSRCVACALNRCFYSVIGGAPCSG